MQSALACYEIITHVTHRAHLAPRATRALVEGGDYDIAWIGQVDGDSGGFTTVASAEKGVETPLMPGDPLPPDWPRAAPLASSSAARVALRRGTPVFMPPGDTGWAFAVVPLDDGLERGGLLVVGRPDGEAIQPAERSRLTALGTALARTRTRLERRAPGDRAWRALRESEARFKAVFHSAAIGMVVARPDGRIVETNQPFQELVGYDAADLVNRSVAEHVHADDLEPSKTLFRELMEGTRTEFRVEQRYVRRDGTALWGKVTVSAVLDHHGGPRLAIGMIEDITQHRRMQQELLQAAKIEALGRFAGGIAHDFNNLLTAIICAAEIVQDELEPDSRLLEDLADIREAADRAAGLTRQLLAFSRRQNSRVQTIDLNLVLGEMGTMLPRLLGEQIEARLELGDDLLLVEADATQVSHAVLHLAFNAKDAMPDGGTLTLRTSRLPPADHPPGLPPGARVRLEVQDTGCGMDADTVARIFDPFFSTKGPTDGSGLGLSTVHGIISKMGGTIRVQSAPGAGTTFSILLPAAIATDAQATVDSQAGSADVEPSSQTILLVEDEAAVRERLQRILATRGYEVHTARDGMDALDVLRRLDRPIDLLLTDLVMPRMGGWALIRRVRERQPGVRALCISGYTAPELDQDRLQDVPLLEKPFTPDRLLQHVRAVLRL